MARERNDAATGSELVLASDPGLGLLAEQLVAAARTHGVQLTGPGGLLTGLTKQVLETALQVEMADHLGYERGDVAGHGSGNSRNGTTAKTLRTDIGEVTVEVPRDRAGTFTPAIVPKRRVDREEVPPPTRPRRTRRLDPDRVRSNHHPHKGTRCLTRKCHRIVHHARCPSSSSATGREAAELGHTRDRWIGRADPVIGRPAR